MIVRSIVEKLGTHRMSKIKVVGDEEVKQSSYGQLVFGKGVSSSLDEQLANEVSKAGKGLPTLPLVSTHHISYGEAP